MRPRESRKPAAILSASLSYALGTHPGRILSGVFVMSALVLVLWLPQLRQVESARVTEGLPRMAALREQAGRNNPVAMVELGRLLFSNGGPRGARVWFSRAAAQGHADGLYHLALVESAPDSARLHLDQAARKGHAGAMFRLGEAWQQGRGGEARADSAVAWFRLAADHAVVEARAALGFCYLQGNGVTADSLRALGWLRSSADGGEPVARAWLADYRLSRGTHADSVAALAILRQASLDGSPASRVRLGQLLLEGPLAWRLEREAAFWLRLAAESGEPKAFGPWARCLEWGRGISADPRQARRWYQRGARAGDALSALRLGRMYREGRGGKANRNQALDWFVRAQQAGNVSALAELGRHFEHGALPGSARWQAAQAWYTEGARRDHAPSQLALARLLQPASARESTGAEALAWLEQAAVTHLPARLELARWTLLGFAVPADPARAAVMYHRAAQEGSREALLALGQLRLQGVGGPRDRREAFQLFKRAAARGLGDAWVQLGLCYQLGWGTPTDFSQAEHCFQQARRQGVVQALADGLGNRLLQHGH